MTTSYLLWSYRETVDVSKSLRLAFDQGAFKDMNLIVKWPVTPSNRVVVLYQLTSNCQTQSGCWPNSTHVSFFKCKNSRERSGQGQINVFVLLAEHKLLVLPIMSSLSWWSVTSHPCWSRVTSPRGCSRRGTAGWLTQSDHEGLKRGWPFNRLAASGSLPMRKAGRKDRRVTD